MLEDNVDEKYYLRDEQVASFLASTEKAKAKGNGFRFEPMHTEKDNVAHTIATRPGSRQTDNFIAMEEDVNRLGGIYDKDNETHQAGSVYSTKGLSPTLSTMQGGNQQPFIVASRGRGEHNVQTLEPNTSGLTNTITSVQKDNLVAIKTANKQGYDMATNGDGIDLAYPNSTTRRGRVGHGVAKTLATGDTMGTMQDFRIRKLTPKECWRLMDFDDSDFDKASKVNSNTQLYKQAGNSIVVGVLEAVLRNLLLDKEKQNG